jgi:hypothetical protein
LMDDHAAGSTNDIPKGENAKRHWLQYNRGKRAEG